MCISELMPEILWLVSSDWGLLGSEVWFLESLASRHPGVEVSVAYRILRSRFFEISMQESDTR